MLCTERLRRFRRTIRAVIAPCLGVMATAVALCGVPVVSAAQQASIQGIATSSSTGGPLEGVAVVLEADGQQVYGTITDRNGFYQIGGISPGTYSLRGRQIGYIQHDHPVTFARGDRLTVNFRLEPDVVALEGIVVSPGRGAAVRDLGRQRVTPADLRLVPVPAGSGDLASYLQTLPGVVTTGDRGGQLFVRGGTAAENLVLVDGIPIYQPFHILGFFSVFPEDLVSSVDFYAGGFGARYSGRTSSVLDVQMRDGNPNGYRTVGSVSPFLAEALIEGPAGPGVSWIASARRSLVEETSELLLGTQQPLTFDSQLLKLTTASGDDLRCSALALRTSDRGRLDPEERESHVSWENSLVGGRCTHQFKSGLLRLVEANFSYSSLENAAVSRGSSRFRSSIGRMQHDAHSTSMIRSIPLYAGYHMYTEFMDHDLTELFGLQRGIDDIFGVGGYVEAAVPIGNRMEVSPGVVLTASPRLGAEPRVRASWQPFGRSSEKLQGALGLYRQDVMGTSDMRDVSSVFTAWMRVPDEAPVEALHGTLGWQQSLGGVRWSVEGYYKRLKDIPVPVWRAVAQFTTHLGRAEGEVYGADTRIEYTSPRFYGFVGYGYAWTQYEASQAEFSTWFGKSVQRYHPPHDRRHQVNAVANLDLAGFHASARWQLGTGLPFTRPLGFDEAFDYSSDLPDVSTRPGTTRLVLERPFTGRLPMMHRLDVSLEREFDLSFGELTAQVGVVNAYDRRNMFYYDLFTGRRVDQLPFAPYASVTVRGR
jgi:hypothetical protein